MAQKGVKWRVIMFYFLLISSPDCIEFAWRQSSRVKVLMAPVKHKAGKVIKLVTTMCRQMSKKTAKTEADWNF